jgi:ATP-dependent DNA helicase Rep
MASTLLNNAQREAIRYLDGPCLVIAGAGSGKTRVITHKIAHLIESGVSAESIAAITFTNNAAREMAERLGRLVSLPAGRRPVVSTFHALGMQMLRRDGDRLGLKRSFSIMDADDAGALVAQALGTTDRKLVRAAQQHISLWKNALIDPDQAAAEASSEQAHQLARVWRSLAATLAAYQSVDFDDLIALPVKLLREHADLAQSWRERLRYLLVDEYQDTNAAQYELLKLLSGPRAAFTAVGDDDQSIYGWRGATLENLRRLQSDFSNLRIIKLEQNYRSSLSILQAANQLIAHNPKLHEKRLWSEHGVGDPVQIVACVDEQAEAESVVMRLSAHRFERRGQWRDYAVLYRGNHQARIIEQVLRQENIPYQLSGGQSFFERAEIRDLMAYLRLLANDDDDPAFIRAVTSPRRGVGEASLAALGEYAAARQLSMFAALFESGAESRLAARQLEPLREFGEFIHRIEWRAAREPAATVLEDLVQAIDYRGWLFDQHDEKLAVARWKNVTDFIDWLKRRAESEEQNLLQLAQWASILAQIDRDETDTDAVRLSTIHASKGLEYPHVFVVGCEEGVLPHLGGLELDEADADTEPSKTAPVTALKDPQGDRSQVHMEERIEEERRLMYVAITRAQRSLSLSWCQTRKRARQALSQKASRFIAEMGLKVPAAGASTVSQADGRARLGALKALLDKR